MPSMGASTRAGTSLFNMGGRGDYTAAMGDKKPKKTSSGSGDAFKAKQAKNQADRAAAAPKDAKPKEKRK